MQAWFIEALISYLFRIQSSSKTHKQMPLYSFIFSDNRWRWHQSVFHQVLAEIPWIFYCKLFTNKRGLLFFRQYILRSILFVSFYIKIISIRFWIYWLSFDFSLQPLLWHFACLQISTMSHSASLLEHWQCFPREDVSLVFALGSLPGNTVPRDVFPCTLPRAQGVYWIIWSL